MSGSGAGEAGVVVEVVEEALWFRSIQSLQEA
jgi:hypothetical protein